MKALLRGLSALVFAAAPFTEAAAEEVLNLYSSRHYQTDEALYQSFTEETGIKINRIEGKGDALIERIKSEGANSPADVLLTVDAGRLWRAEQAGLFQPVSSKRLEEVVPANLRHPEGLWFGFSTRARLIYYARDRVEEGAITRYEDLADPKWQGKVCIRSSSNIYNQSLLGSIIAAHGVKAAEDWAKGVVGNFARDPQGGDTDQLRGIVSGECDISMSNTYYFGRAIRKDVDGLPKDAMENIGWVFPNQDSIGAHMNLSGGGVAANAPNKDNAVKFLEYLASDQAQEYFSAGNDEYPAVPGVGVSPSVASLGFFKPDDLDATAIANNVPAAQMLLNEAGWK